MGSVSYKYRWIIIGTLLLILMFYQFNQLLSSNSIWLMIAAKRWLAGGTYAHDFVENNPPLIVYFSAIPVLIAKLLSTDLQTAMRLFLFSLSVGLLLFCELLLNCLFEEKEKTKVALLLIAIAFAYWIIPGVAFSERENITVMMIMPYVLCLALRCEKKSIPVSLAVLAGFLGAIGFGLKPYFLFPWVLIEIYGMLVVQKIRQCFRPEMVTLCITLIFYFISIFILTPTYMQTIFPMVVHFYLGYEKESLLQMLDQASLISPLIALLLPILFYRSIAKKDHHLMWLFYLSLIGFLFSYLSQEKIWYYHAIPIFSFSLMVLCLTTLSLEKKRLQLTQRLLFYILLLAALFDFTSPYLIKSKYAVHYSQYHQFALDIKKNMHNGSVYFFTTELGDFSIAFLAHAEISPRFAAFWMLPGMLDCFNHGAQAPCYPKAMKLKQYLLKAVVEDFEQYRPSLVLVHTSDYQRYLYEPPYLMIAQFDYLEFFSQDPAFKQIWKNYRYVKTDSNYKMYVRIK